jgi:heptosyltransferase-3
MEKQNILMIQLRQLGDILLTSPCLRAVKEDNPEHRLTFLCHTMGREILQDSPYLDELITYNDKSAFEYWQMAFSLRKRGFTMVFDFMANPRSAKLAWLSRSPQRFAFSTGRNWAFTHIIPRQTESDYIVREKFELLKAAGFHPTDESLFMPWSPEKDLGPYRELMQHPEFASAPFKVALSPTHRRENRRWPLENYIQLAERLVREKNAGIVWTWGPGEEGIIADLVQRTQVRTFASPRTRLKELTALLSKLDLFIGNPNGASHFAVAAGCATLKLCGPQTETRAWSPLTEKHRIVKVWDDIKNLSVEAVWKAIP